MHKDPPPGLFDLRRSVTHVVTAGLAAGFLFAVVTQFGWSLWRQSRNSGVERSAGSDALVRQLSGDRPAAKATPAVRY